MLVAILCSIHKMGKFIERYKLPELKQEEIETINSPVLVKELGIYNSKSSQMAFYILPNIF